MAGYGSAEFRRARALERLGSDPGMPGNAVTRKGEGLYTAYMALVREGLASKEPLPGGAWVIRLTEKGRALEPPR